MVHLSAPRASVNAWCCMDVSRFSAVGVADLYAWQPYSILDLTSDLYSMSSVDLSAPNEVPETALIKLSACWHFVTTLLMCSLKVRCWSNVSPKNLALFATCNGVSCMYSLKCCLSCLYLCPGLPKRTATVFSCDSLKPHFIDQSVIVFSDFSLFVSLCMFLSLLFI